MRTPILLFSLLFAACTAAEPETAPPAVASQAGWTDGGSFAGTIPCASCPGIEMLLDLNEDGTFTLESTYLEAEDGEDRAVSDIGRWAVTRDESMLILRGGTEGAKRFQITGPDTLGMLNNLGEPIDSDLPYHLVRTTGPARTSPELRLSGMYRYMADAAVFLECRTRMTYPVVFEEDHRSLEEAYLGARSGPGEPLFASFIGRLEMRPPMEGDGERLFVVVSEFDTVVPGRGCHEEELPLEGTTWTVIEMDGHGIDVDDGGRRPSLFLSAPDSTASGSGGCNRFTGGYTVSSDSLTFGQMASTMMACADMMDVESKYFEILNSAAVYDLYGSMLELWADGRFLARFEGTPGQLTD